MTIKPTTAREHALLASEMLASLTRLEERLENLSDDDRLQMTATGGFTRVNRDMEWSARIALTHAVTAIAMAMAVSEPTAAVEQ